MLHRSEAPSPQRGHTPSLLSPWVYNADAAHRNTAYALVRLGALPTQAALLSLLSDLGMLWPQASYLTSPKPSFFLIN